MEPLSEEDGKLWHDKPQEAERVRSGYQDLAARGLLTYEELEETKAAARRELDALKAQWERLEDLKRDRDVLLATPT